MKLFRINFSKILMVVLMTLFIFGVARNGHATKIEINQGHLWVNGESFTIKGVGYSPIPIGIDPETTPPYGDYFTSDYSPIYERDLALLRQVVKNGSDIDIMEPRAVYFTLKQLWAAGGSTSLDNPTCPSTINFGQTVQCSIGAAGEMDSFTFSASANDKVLIRMSMSGCPRIRLYGPDGTKLVEAGDIDHSTAEITSTALASTGTYTIIASAYSCSGSGNYGLTLERLSTLPEWIRIPGAAISSPALAWNPVAAEMQIVVRASDNSLWAGTFNSSGVFNNDWTPIPGATASAPALAWNPMANELQMVVRAADDSIWTATFNSSGIFNHDWASIPGRTPSSTALAWNPSANELQMVVRAADDSIWTATFNSSGIFNHDWASIPGRTPSSTALAWNPGANKLQIVVRASNDSIWAGTFNSSGVFNNDWAPIPGATPSSPAVAWDVSTSEVCIVVRASNDSIWFGTFNSSGSFNNDWVNIPGSTPSSPGMAYLPSIGYLGIVVRGSDDSLWELLY
jgi:hypothetical protein